MSDRLWRPKVQLDLPNGDSIVLVNMLAKGGSPDEVNRNVYRISSDGAVLWQIGSDAQDGERQPYTNIYFDQKGHLKA